MLLYCYYLVVLFGHNKLKLKAELVKVFNDHTNVEYVTFNEKGSQIASGGQDNLIQINELC